MRTPCAVRPGGGSSEHRSRVPGLAPLPEPRSVHDPQLAALAGVHWFDHRRLLRTIENRSPTQVVREYHRQQEYMNPTG